MRIYLAGTSVSNPKEEKVIQRLFKKGHKLHSYYHCVDGFESKWFKTNKKNRVDLFIDSGAFSAWTQNIKIDINDYIKFIKNHENVISVYANLDVIGIGGKMPNKKTAQLTLKNQKLMERAGLNPIPVYHYGEPFSYLKRYVNNYEYLAIGVAGNSGNKLIPWLDKCFSDYICDKKGNPKIKVHGFAVIGFHLLFRYPWYSVDSTSWVITGRLGSIFIPKFNGGNWQFDKPPLKIAVSSQSPNLKDAGKHITNLSPRQRIVLENYLSFMGYELGESHFDEYPQDTELK
ncbi:MAG: hypothetical protein ACOC2U_00225, partial [bacterium]